MPRADCFAWFVKSIMRQGEVQCPVVCVDVDFTNFANACRAKWDLRPLASSNCFETVYALQARQLPGQARGQDLGAGGLLAVSREGLRRFQA